VLPSMLTGSSLTTACSVARGSPPGVRYACSARTLVASSTARGATSPLTGIGFLLLSTGTNPRSPFGLSSALFLLCSFGGLFLADAWFLWRSHHLRPGIDAQDA